MKKGKRTVETLEFRKEEGVAIITFNRPKSLNALNSAMLTEIVQLMDEVAKDGEIKAVIFTGAGEKAFVAGADIKEMKDMDSLAAMDFGMLGREALTRIDNLSKPTIAAINGYALGGGCEIALACDIRIASENAVMGFPEITLGILPGLGGTQRASRLVGLGKAKEMIFTGDFIPAGLAREIGLVNTVVPADKLLAEAMNMARKIASRSAAALKLAKTAINKGVNMSLEEALVHELQCFALCFSTLDQKEGMAAFLEKRAPRFIDR